MFDFINYGTDQIQIFFLILLRATGLFVMAPIFSDQGIPKLVRAGLLILVSLVLLSAMNLPPIKPAESLWQLAGLAVRETLVGFVIGLVFRVLFAGVLTAGSLVGYQLGMAMVTVFDSNLASQVSVVGRLWYWLALMIFLGINGHHLVISAFADSYEAIPVGGLATEASFGETIIRYTAYLFVIAMKIASPIMISLFMTDVALGTVAKMMPTMNVFFIGFPLKVAIGFVVMGMSLPICAYVLERALAYLDGELRVLINAMGAA